MGPDGQRGRPAALRDLTRSGPPGRTAAYPTNAAKIFRWGDAQWFDNVVSPVKRAWAVNQPGLVRDQHGMLTIDATGTSGYHCGARSIVLADYALGTSTANAYFRNAPSTEFRASRAGLTLGPGPFHTYAVEVTPDHVSWFVDTRVVMTERRPEARTGATYAARFRLVGTPGARMNPGRMQMDWVRCYSLARRSARSVEAPPAEVGTYADAC